MRFHQITYGLLAGLTPVLVLANSLVVSSESAPAQAWQPLPIADGLMVSEPITMVNAYAAMPIPTVSTAASAGIVPPNGQSHLEFYHSLDRVHQMPNL
ncbi:MAG: hypothetical protein AAF827_18780 [Cyanobacteria bacterium P01_D01_bin.6]